MAWSLGSLTLAILLAAPVFLIHGSRLEGNSDRLAALGDELDVMSLPGDGATVAGRLPLTEGTR